MAHLPYDYIATKKYLEKSIWGRIFRCVKVSVSGESIKAWLPAKKVTYCGIFAAIGSVFRHGASVKRKSAGAEDRRTLIAN